MFFYDKTLKYDDKNGNNYDEKFFYSDYSIYICLIKLKDMKVIIIGGDYKTTTALSLAKGKTVYLDGIDLNLDSCFWSVQKDTECVIIEDLTYDKAKEFMNMEFITVNKLGKKSFKLNPTIIITLCK